MFKFLIALLIFIPIVYYIARWYLHPMKHQQRIKAYAYAWITTRKMCKDIKREMIHVFGGIPKRTKYGAKVGKRKFTNAREFNEYIEKCILEKNSKLFTKIANKEDTTNEKN